MEVIADNSGKFCGNACRYATHRLAQEAAVDLAGRWTLVQDWRVVESDEPVNRCRYCGGRGPYDDMVCRWESCQRKASEDAAGDGPPLAR